MLWLDVCTQTEVNPLVTRVNVDTGKLQTLNTEQDWDILKLKET